METITLKYVDVFDKEKTKEITFSKHLLGDGFRQKSLFALMVDGKSMEPLINDRAVIVADLSQKQLIDEKIYLVNYENKVWVKKYKKEKDSFISINPGFSNLIYKKIEVNIVARVIFTFTKL